MVVGHWDYLDGALGRNNWLPLFLEAGDMPKDKEAWVKESFDSISLSFLDWPCDGLKCLLEALAGTLFGGNRFCSQVWLDLCKHATDFYSTYLPPFLFSR